MSNASDNKFHRDKKLQLFLDLKNTVERIISRHPADILYVHGGISFVVNCFTALFEHGYKGNEKYNDGDYWPFLQELAWFNQTYNIEVMLPAKSSASYKLPRKKHCQVWMETALKNKCLSFQLQPLLNEENPTNQYYYEWAFLRDVTSVSAMMVCLQALEQNSPPILAEIPLKLLMEVGIREPQRFVRLHNTGPSASDKHLMEKCMEANLHKVSPSESFDPLSGNFKLKKIFPQSRKVSAVKVDEDGQDMGSVVSLPQCLGGSSSNKQTSSTKYHALQGNFYSKPLFDDSSELDEGNLTFLSTITSENTSDMTVTNSHLFQHSESSFKAESSINNMLPDVVASAEEAIISQSAMRNSTGKTTHMEPQFDDLLLPVFKDFVLDNESTGIDDKLEAKSNAGYSFAADINQPKSHRRCKSDHIQTYSTIDGNLQIAATSSSALKPSISFPSLRDLNEQLSAELTNEKMVKSRSLMTYLQNQDLTTCADIDKENAHFHFSEMLIGAIEQVKCQIKKHNLPTKALEADNLVMDANVGQPPLSDVASMESTPLMASCEYSSPVGSISAESHLSQASSDLSFQSQRTESPHKPPSQVIESNLNKLSRMDSFRTAESIAIGLLKTFSGQRRVTASEVDWLIPEEDVPQKLLPLPMSVAIDFDAATSDTNQETAVRIRGNHDWAPPRAQIIFHAPLKLKLKNAMQKQNYRCAGCGTLVNKAYIKRFRYCEYLGKYFCSCCHDNKLSVIPAFVLHKFDFRRYKVSNFSFDLIGRIYDDPLFNLNDINAAIYKKVKSLQIMKDLRSQLLSLYKYLKVCRFATTSSADEEQGNSLLMTINSLVSHHMLEGDLHVYSLNDLFGVKSGSLLPSVKDAVAMAAEHVNHCQLCQMKGFICELCNDGNDIIFPHQQNTLTCVSCHSCYHVKCYNKSQICPKCQRISKRKELLKNKI